MTVDRIREHRQKVVYSHQFSADVNGVKQSFQVDYISQADFYVFDEGHNRGLDDRSCHCQATNKTLTRILNLIQQNSATTAVGSWTKTISNTQDSSNSNCNNYLSHSYQSFVDNVLGNDATFRTEIDADNDLIQSEIASIKTH